MTTSRQPKASTSKASGPRSVRRRDGLSVHICETCGSCVDGNAPLRKFDPDWEYKIDDLIITASLKAREVLVDGIGKLYRSNGTAPRAPAPASSEKALGTKDIVLKGEAYGCYMSDGKWHVATPSELADAKPAEPARGGSPRLASKTGRRKHEHEWSVRDDAGLRVCLKQDCSAYKRTPRRGAPPPARTKRKN